jgi:hypothetical protein
MGRSLRTRWDLFKPDVERRVTASQWKQQGTRVSARLRVLKVGQSVIAKNFCSGPEWIPGVIMERLGAANGRIWKRHLDHLKDTPNSETEVCENDVPLT